MPDLSPLDAATRRFWRLTGRPVDLGGEHTWLDAPRNAGPDVGDAWVEQAARALGGRPVHDLPGAGLYADLSVLDGPGFRAADLHPLVRDFYEHTAGWGMDAWTQWNLLFQPGGELISRFFGRRLRQLALPTRPLDVSRGMDSRVVALLDGAGAQQGAAWLRTLRATGEWVFSGCYTVRTLPGAGRPSVHVTFPLEAGNVQVFLRPRVLAGGALELSSPAGPFGADGAYVTVSEHGRAHAARVPLHETFTIFVDDEGVLRTDHSLRLWSATVVRLHYKLTGP
ncbi:hypothetical protein KIH74_04965 [Kineosporia sp. J2-2]|uniref:Uncharacterized protein n=1 Tax=Kineosporia corallincola TaxID=2835133 RepID=A0ABS5TB53_9ACTN|nr:hypothetical protein [Kineosporia corallincola]MBT0768261.1 hypothetical protein [Kineosporia corallincola]